MTTKAEPNHLAEILQVATGEMTKEAYAAILDVHPSTVSRTIAQDYERLIKKLQAEKIALQADASNRQATIKALQSECNQRQADASNYEMNLQHIESERKTLQERYNELQEEYDTLETSEILLQARVDAMQGQLKQWQGQPTVIQWLASTNARTVMLFLLAAFEGVGSFNLLLPKGIALALPVSLALAFALLVFTAFEHKFGKWFCVAFAVAVGGIYFDVFPQDWQRFLFAFTPPVVAALIAFSLKPEHNGKQ